MAKLGIPREVKTVLTALEKADFEAYIVGGCVRDLLQEREPKDWDVTTNAKPENVSELFPDSFCENTYGTVTVKTGAKKVNLQEIEVTTYRIDEKYSDKRHPDRVSFAASLEQDLKRRDFTVNAMAMDAKLTLVDLFHGQQDLKNKLIRAVGDPKDRFNEDALRMMRAVRLATELGFSAQGGPASGWNIEQKTFQAIKENAHLIHFIAKERIRDELMRIIDAKNAYDGILLLQQSGLLRLIIPELDAGVGVAQNKHHIYTVFEHNTLSLKWAAEHEYPFHVKLAALFHDIGKPQTKRGEGPNSTFYGHEIVGAKITKQVLGNLCFPTSITQLISSLVKNHLFYYNIGEVTAKSVRRLVAKVGPEHMNDLVKVRICDRMGSGVPKPEPYRLRHFRYMVEKVQKDPISVKLLEANGEDIMKILEITPGPKVGQILAILLDHVLDDPKLNTTSFLTGRIKELGKLTDQERETLAKKAKEKEGVFERAVDEKIKEKYWVK